MVHLSVVSWTVVGLSLSSKRAGKLHFLARVGALVFMLLYNKLFCPSVGWSVGWSGGPSVCHHFRKVRDDNLPFFMAFIYLLRASDTAELFSLLGAKPS